MDTLNINFTYAKTLLNYLILHDYVRSNKFIDRDRQMPVQEKSRSDKIFNKNLFVKLFLATLEKSFPQIDINVSTRYKEITSISLPRDNHLLRGIRYGFPSMFIELTNLKIKKQLTNAYANKIFRSVNTNRNTDEIYTFNLTNKRKPYTIEIIRHSGTSTTGERKIEPKVDTVLPILNRELQEYILNTNELDFLGWQTHRCFFLQEERLISILTQLNPFVESILHLWDLYATILNQNEFNTLSLNEIWQLQTTEQI